MDVALDTGPTGGAIVRIEPTTLAQWVAQGLVQKWRTPGGYRRLTDDEVRTLAARLAYEAATELA